MINLKIITILVIVCLLIIHNLFFKKFSEDFNSSYPVYGSAYCKTVCQELEDGYSFENLCDCKSCCEDNYECNPAFKRIIDFYDWADGKDCKFDE